MSNATENKAEQTVTTDVTLDDLPPDARVKVAVLAEAFPGISILTCWSVLRICRGDLEYATSYFGGKLARMAGGDGGSSGSGGVRRLGDQIDGHQRPIPLQFALDLPGPTLCENPQNNSFSEPQLPTNSIDESVRPSPNCFQGTPLPTQSTESSSDDSSDDSDLTIVDVTLKEDQDRRPHKRQKTDE